MEKLLQSMMKRFPWFILMGFMMVMIAVIIGAVNAGNAAAYFAVDKTTRETSMQWAQARAGIESTGIWLPYFKFLGVAMILSGITMALGVIGMRLQKLGKMVMAGVPENARVPIPGRPASVMLMRMFMMLGMLIILAGFIVSLSVAGTALAVFSNPISVIDSASTGSQLLDDLARVHAAETWLEAFKFVGVAFFFLGIVNGLQTIVFALRYQWDAIPRVAEKLPPISQTTVPATD